MVGENTMFHVNSSMTHLSGIFSVDTSKMGNDSNEVQSNLTKGEMHPHLVLLNGHGAMGTIMPAGFAIGVNEKEQVAKEERRNEWTKTRRTASRARTRKPACSLTLLKVGETTRSLPRCRSSRSMVEQAAPRHHNFHLSPHGQKWQAKRGGGERRQSPFNLRPGQ